ncbi:hypothetical protein IAU60_001329 [Kwoniella sp. DSM 27419]
MSTIRSLPAESSASGSSAYVPPDAAPAILRQVIVSGLLRKGFEGAEAGALAEIERLLERHVTNLFQDASEYAHLAGRRDVNALDVTAVVDEGENAWSVRRLSRESRRKQNHAPPLALEASPPPSPIIETLATLMAEEADHPSADPQREDRKPDLFSLGPGLPHGSSTGGKRLKSGDRLTYAGDWMPALPERWTYVTTPGGSVETQARPAIADQPSLDRPTQPPPVTSDLLNFIKLTATERGDIPPELGVVDYRRQVGAAATGMGATGQGGEAGRKRKWGVRAAGA